ncbi:DNA polymerase III subunit delta [Chitinibacter bivalviorum]|uniref:DNA polymerase III subunit delta n=1 Tax=Chitinibacter bivalviorum TaxID=2739434 RepID=A0A7H9BE68_9NEIS|nr:DNA polymerase III subunit delta [Chitinibacter bivalviorum]QLG87013.1 DNA polymerase III subunit delta [Chitinibacter bivalviorum]
MRPDELPKSLQRGLAPLYVIHGDEALLALEAAQQIRDAARQAGFSEREVLTVENAAHFQWSQLTASGASMSLFAELRLLELRIPNGKPGIEGGKALEAFTNNIPSDILTIITLPKLDKTALNSKWMQALAKVGEVIEAKLIERSALPSWINQRLAAQGQSLASDAMEWLVERVEGNLLAAHQEIQKLALLHPKGELSLADLEAAVANVARYDVFSLGEAVLTGDAARICHMIEGLRAEGESAVLVLWALAEETRTLYKFAQGRSRGTPAAQLIKEMRIWGNKQRLIERAAERVNAKRLKSALQHARKIDGLIKGIGDGDVWHELTDLALLLINPKPARR